MLAIFYLNRSGCQWDMLPHDLLPKSTVYDYFAQWRDDGTWQKILDALRREVRTADGEEPSPSAGSIDSQTVKASEIADEPGIRRGQEEHRAKAAYHRGYLGFGAGGLGDGGVGGRWHDRTGGPGPTHRRAQTRLEKIWADGKYSNHHL